ncbi:class I SAM-dependent methyltransferase [Rubrivivax gelatinosus]|nr:class I SAM-dependent methyltransferase [Rubrivivax gelatinosus]
MANDNHWARLWANGASDSFGHGLDERSAQDAPMAARWRAWFSNLPDGCEVLDIGTGNGALLRHLLAARTQDPGLRFVGVDAAALPDASNEGAGSAAPVRARLLGGVRAESLPFGDNCFDVVVSQFGIEYATLPAALSEVGRVLRSGGTVALLMHHRGGRPVSLARAERHQAQWLLSALLPAAAPMAEAMSKIGTESGRRELADSAHWSAVRATYDRVLADAGRRMNETMAPDLLVDAQNWVAQAFQRAAQGGAGAGRQALANIEQLILDQDRRLEDLLQRALDEDAIRSVVASMNDSGLKPGVVETAEDRGYLMGWWVEATRI